MTATVDPNVLRSSRLGRDLDPDEAAALAAVMEARVLEDGEELVSEGDSDPALYLLASGKLQVLTSAQGEPEIVHTMVIGECAGTRAFVDRTPRVATIRASGEASVYALKPERLEALLDSRPSVVYKVMRGVFRATHANLERVYRQAQQLINYVTKTHGRY